MNRKPRTVAGVLRKALALIEDRYSWIKSDYYVRRKNGRECFCANGAIERAATGAAEPNGFMPVGTLGCLAEDALMANLPAGFRSVEGFNDDMDTTHRDVVDLFKRAIASVSK
jgi:hypothetical protein